jgi:hypothetical protein
MTKPISGMKYIHSHLSRTLVEIQFVAETFFLFVDVILTDCLVAKVSLQSHTSMPLTQGLFLLACACVLMN